MVNSDQLFKYVVEKSSALIRVGADETKDYIEPFLADEDLVDALGEVVRLVEAETHAQLAREQMKLVLSHGGPDFGPPAGIPIPAAN